MRYITLQENGNYMVPDEIRAGILALRNRCARKPDRGGLGLKAPSPERGEVAVRTSHVASWVLMRFLALPREEQDRFWQEGRQILDQHMESDEPLPIVADRPFAEPVVSRGVPGHTHRPKNPDQGQHAIDMADYRPARKR